jgi:hypothetical protein
MQKLTLRYYASQAALNAKCKICKCFMSHSPTSIWRLNLKRGFSSGPQFIASKRLEDLGWPNISILLDSIIAYDYVDCDEDALFQYTSGRWLWDETAQFSHRYIKFNVKALTDIAARSIGSLACVEIRKLPEGNFNKVFLLTMNDGKNVIAKIPNPNAGRPHFTTASEVATMDFVR